jgi:aminoacyl tRNA synthase complex-interacting multifunctional protein 1
MEDAKIAGILELLGVVGPYAATEGTQLNTRLKEIIRSKGLEHLLGSSDAELTSWLSLAQSISSLGSDIALKNMCEKINSTLRTKSFCVGQSLTVADVALFYSIANCQHWNDSVLSGSGHVLRWMNHISSLCLQKPFTQANVAPTIFQLNSKPKSAGAPAAGKAEVATASTESKPVAATAAAAAAAEVTAPEQKKEKKEKAAKPAAAVVAEVELDPSKLDIRVGLITKCWAHPESDKLYCEEIDCGEEAVRSIASGLRAFYPNSSDIENRLVLVLANLKERPLAGFKSQGMVLCASSDDHTVVQLVDAPAGSKPGDRVVFKGFDGEPATPAQIAKKKIFEKLAPDLKTDEHGVAHWGSVPFTVGGELCRSSVTNAHVS